VILLGGLGIAVIIAVVIAIIFATHGDDDQ